MAPDLIGRQAQVAQHRPEWPAVVDGFYQLLAHLDGNCACARRRNRALGAAFWASRQASQSQPSSQRVRVLWTSSSTQRIGKSQTARNCCSVHGGAEISPRERHPDVILIAWPPPPSAVNPRGCWLD